MASYWRVSPKFWSDPKVLAWDDDTRLLALYILTCPHRTTEGLFRLPPPYVLADLGWPAERLAEPFARLLSDGFIEHDPTTHVVLIVKALEYQAPENPNQVKAAVRLLADLPPAPALTCHFRRLAERFCERLAEGLPEGFGKPPAPTPSPSPSHTGTVDDAPTDSPVGRASGGEDLDEGFEEFWADYPRKTNRKDALGKWRARRREGVPVADLLTACRNYARNHGKSEPRFIMHGATFLGAGERWREWADGGAALGEVRPIHGVDTGTWNDWMNTPGLGNLSVPMEDLLP